jgi:hypothetical protein
MEDRAGKGILTVQDISQRHPAECLTEDVTHGVAVLSLDLQ